MKAVNKDKVVIKVGENVLIVDKINAPKFYIKDQELTEYDIRNLMVQVKKGLIPHTLLNHLGVIDEYGVQLIFRKDGRLKSEHKGLSVLSKLVMDLF